MDHITMDQLITFFAPVFGAYLEKHYGWWSWVEDNVLFCLFIKK